MSSKRIVRSRSLESGVTPRRLNQVVLPEPGSPMVNTTKPRDGRVTLFASGGTALGDSGCVSRISLPSGIAAPSAGGWSDAGDAAGPSAAAALSWDTTSRSRPTTGDCFAIPLAFAVAALVCDGWVEEGV